MGAIRIENQLMTSRPCWLAVSSFVLIVIDYDLRPTNGRPRPTGHFLFAKNLKLLHLILTEKKNHLFLNKVLLKGIF